MKIKLLIISLLICLKFYGQSGNDKIDRLEIGFDFTPTWMVDILSEKHQSFVQISDSTFAFFIASNSFEILALIVDKSGHVIDDNVINISHPIFDFRVKECKKISDGIILLIGFETSTLVKLSFDLVPQWIKRINPPFSNSEKYIAENMTILGSNIYLCLSGDSTTYLYKIDKHGQGLGGVKIVDFSRLITWVPEIRNSAFAVSWIDKLAVISYNGVDTITSDKSLNVFLFDTLLNPLNEKHFQVSSFYDINNYYLNANSNLLNIEISNGFSVEKISLDNQLNLTNMYKNEYIENGVGITYNGHLFSNEHNFIDNKVSFYRIGYVQVQNTFKYVWADFLVIDENYNSGIINSRHFSWRVNGNPLIKKVRLEGVIEDGNQYKLLKVEDPGVLDTINYFDVISINKTLDNFSCGDSYPISIQSQANSIFVDLNYTSPKTPTSFLNTDLNYTARTLSLNQFQFCGPSFDTCAELSVRILEDPKTLCQNKTRGFHVVSYMADQFVWYVNGMAQDTSNVFAYNFKTPGLQNIKVRAFPMGSKTCFKEDSISIFVNTAPGNLINDTTVCKGDTVQLQAYGAQSYRWFPPSTLSCVPCSNPIISTEDSLTFFITGTDSLGCTNVDTFHLNVYPDVNASISGSNTVCPGSIDVWFGLNPLDSFIANWWIDTVGIITQDFGDSIYTEWPMGIDSAFVYAYVQYPAGCEGDTIRFKVKVNEALEPAILVNDDSICFNDRLNVTYNLSYNTNGSIYLWEIANGQILSGDSSSSIIVNWDSVGLGKLIVREYSTTSIDTCYGEDSVFIEILPNPENILNLIGKENVCLDEEVEYSINLGWLNSTYDWITQQSDTLIGQGNASIISSWDTLGDYEVSVQEVSEYGCTGPKDSLQITVHPLPNTQRVGDDTLLCLSDLSDQFYTVSGLSNSTFQWQIIGGRIKTGQTTNQVLVDWDSSIIKDLKVIELSEFGCSSDSLQIKQYFDLSRLELFVVSVKEDSSIQMDFELESLRSYPGDSIWVARRSEEPNLSNWMRIERIEKTRTAFEDYSINANQSSFGYRVEGLNSCAEDIISRDHANVFLSGKRGVKSESGSVIQSAREIVELKWTPYRNWDEGVKTYELYEKFDSAYIKVAESQQSTLTFDPTIPKREHCFRIRALQIGDLRESWSNAFCIELERALNIPNVITQNGDQKNDFLQIENLEAWPDHHLIIYNRWGQSIFQSTSYQNNWPQEDMVSGTYFYHITIQDKETGFQQDFKGWVQVLR